jgi:glycerol-3-phosphate cytidylyltransferase
MLLTLTETVKYLKSIPDEKIGFTCSCFDLFHAGHILMLKDAAEQCDLLVVGLQTDPTIDVEYRKNNGQKKNTPIQSYEERLIQLEACKYVDLIIKYSSEDDLLNILKTLKPDVRILGTDWKNKKYTGHELDIKIHWHNRDHDYSTSNLRKKIYLEESQINNSLDGPLDGPLDHL